MAILSVLKYPDARLTISAEPIDTIDECVKQVIKDMIETMYENDGAGLAATQVNVPKQLFVMDLSAQHESPEIFINPVILSKTGTIKSEEACLSVPGVSAAVTRASQIELQALNEYGEKNVFNIEGMRAICIQHEMDHLQGKLYLDHLSVLKRHMIDKKLKKLKGHHY